MNAQQRAISEQHWLDSARAYLGKRYSSIAQPHIIPYQKYLQRIAKYANCSDECLIMSLIYVDRIQEMNQSILKIKRFIMTSIMIAAKFQDDEYYKNEYYARVGGISKSEINNLEQIFLQLIDHRLYVSNKYFDTYLEKLAAFVEQEESKKN